MIIRIISGCCIDYPADFGICQGTGGDRMAMRNQSQMDGVMIDMSSLLYADGE